jgi:radical SAM superfamily enzyme YgiQ (UPF0313 family)/very-short-patch-repair endonuclease
VKKYKVSFVQPNFQQGPKEFNAFYLPYSIGVIWAYAQNDSKIKESFEVDQLVWRREDVDLVAARLSQSNIVAFSTYVWNHQYNYTLAAKVRELNPEALILFGGPEPAITDPKIFETMPWCDAIIKHEGEITFRAILHRYLQGQSFEDLPGILINKKGQPVDTGDAKRIESLDDIPSPYLIGLYDQIIEENPDIEWNATLETNRGCPFQCFTGNTKIITSNGANKKAKFVDVGDKLIGLNEVTKELVETEVVKKFEYTTNEIYVIHFDDGSKIETTKEHPFYVKGQWIEAKDLKIGEEIYNITPNDKIAFNKKLYNPVKDNEVKKKISNSVKKLFAAGVLNAEHLKSQNRSIQHKNRLREYQNTKSGQQKRQRSSERMTKNNPMFDKQTRQKATDTLKRKIALGEIVPYMRTEEYWNKLSKGPNKQEKEVFEFLMSEFGHRYEFSGTGSYRIGYYSPDFVDREHKKIIEYNGCYWHGCDICNLEKINQRDKDRQKVFESAGFKVHFIRSCEFTKNKEKVFSDLRTFTYNGKKIISVRVENRQETVYNFECSPHHNFFADYLLSHNCTFCDWGSLTYNKVKKFELQRVYDELEWFGKHRCGFLSITDANFGMFPERDNLIADKIIEVQKKYGYPKTFSVAWAKNQKREVVDIVKKLLEAPGFNQGLTLSVQSLDVDVLENIRRRNMEVNKLEEVFELCEQRNIPTYTEMILGLPGETLESWKENFWKLFRMGNHTGLTVFQAQLLQNAEMNLLQRRLYGIKSTVVTDYFSGSYSNEHIEEGIEVVTATKDLPPETMLDAEIFSWYINNFHVNGITTLISRVLYHLKGIDYQTFYTDFFEYLQQDAWYQKEQQEVRQYYANWMRDGKINHPSLAGIEIHGWNLIHRTVLNIHVEKKYDHVFGLVDRFIDRYNLEPELRENVMRFQREYLIAYNKVNQYPKQLELNYNIWEFVTQGHALERKKSILELEFPEDKSMSFSRFLELYYFARRRNFGKAQVTIKDVPS